MTNDPLDRRIGRRNFVAGVSAAGIAGTATGAQAKTAESKKAEASAKTPPPSQTQLAQDEDFLDAYPAGLDERYFIRNPGSDYMVDVLRALNIEYMPINAASSFRGLHESILNYGGNRQPEILTCLHEEQAVAFSQGYFKVTGRPLVIACHGTVGIQHAAMAVYNAWADQVPMILIGGNHGDAASRRSPIEWVHSAQDPMRPIRDFIKWDDEPVTLTHFSESMARAYRVAMTPPRGPVAITLDAHLQEDSISGETPPLPELPEIIPPQGNSTAVAEAARMLVEAESPVILADRAIHTSEGLARLVELAEMLQAPVVDMGGRLNFPTNHYLNQSMNSGRAISGADVILGLELSDVWGAINRMQDLAHREWAPRIRSDAQVVTIGVGDTFIKSNYQDFGRYARVDMPVTGDVEATLPVLLDAVRDTITRQRRQAISARADGLRAAAAEARKGHIEAARYGWTASPVSTARICMEVWDRIKDMDQDWGLVSGVNFLGNWPRKLWDMTEPHHYIGTSGAGGIGYGIGAAAGAALAHKEAGRIAVNLQSDGDLLFAPGALWTAAHLQVPLLTVMHNNRAYHQEVMHVQRMASRRERGVDGMAKIGSVFEDPPVDFAAIARGFGMWSAGPITDPEQLGPALDEALEVVASGAPALIDVVAQPR